MTIQPISETSIPLAFDRSILAGQLTPSSIRMYARDFRTYLTYARTLDAALDPTTLARWRALLTAVVLHALLVTYQPGNTRRTAQRVTGCEAPQSGLTLMQRRHTPARSPSSATCVPTCLAASDSGEGMRGGQQQAPLELNPATGSGR